MIANSDAARFHSCMLLSLLLSLVVAGNTFMLLAELVIGLLFCA